MIRFNSYPCLSEFDTFRPVIERHNRLVKILDLSEDTNENKQLIEKISIAIQKIWSEVDSSINSSAHLLRLEQYNKEMSNIYSKFFDLSPHKLHKLILDDLKCVVKPIFQRSVKGTEGVVLVGGKKHPFVLKSTKQIDTEIFVTQCYEKILKDLQVNKVCVPETDGIDLFNQKYLGSGSVQSLPLTVAQSLKLHVNLIEQDAQIIEGVFQDNLFMRSQMVEGQSLSDFLYITYPSLTLQEQRKFFEGIGSLAFLDIIIGNLDRLIKVNYDEDSDTFGLEKDEPANLENMLISENNDPFKPNLVYGIDNGISSLVIDPKNHQKYLEFLEQLFTPLDWAKILATHIKGSILSAIESDETPQGKVIQKKDLFTNLNERIEISVLASGLNDMALRLMQRPAIASQDSKSNDPQELLNAAISQRFRVVQQILTL